MSDPARYRRASYSQVAEDLIIAFLLRGHTDKTYVDIGCLWPVQHSNTYLFYQNGGRGLCIDANPDVAETFRAERPRDIFVNAAVWSERGSMPYHRFENPVFSTLDTARANTLAAQDRAGRRLVKTVEVEAKPLTDILAETAFQTETVDFLSIDVEGAEMSVLAGIDFEQFRPTLVVLETALTREPVAENPVSARMADVGYDLVAYTGHDAFFKRRR